jgi:hypothetical protein
MIRARVVNPPRLAAVALVATLVAAGAAAQQEPPKPSASTAGMSIVLPSKLVAGERATLAVLDASGRLAAHAVVAFTGGEHMVTDVSGRVGFTAPREAGVLLARMPAGGASASTTVVAPWPNSPDGVQVIDYARFVAMSDRIVVDGVGFRGEADANHVTLNGQPVLVLAASPIALVLLPGPSATQGPAQLVIEVGGRSAAPVPVTLVSWELMGPNKQLTPGEKGKLTVRVRGTDQRLTLEARNLSPEAVEMPRGNVQRVTSSGGSNNYAEIELQGVRAGEFSVGVRIVPGALGLPDVDAARRQLVTARQFAPREWQERLERLIRRMESDPQDVPRFREELEKLLAEKPAGEFARLIEAAWLELLKR